MTNDSPKIDLDKEELASKLKGSLLYFTEFFFKHITGREFVVSQPIGRESHHITICRELTRVFRLEVPSQRLMISVPPGHAKSTLLSMWIAWAMAHYPDSRFIYVSYSATLAARHTDFIKRIISSAMYKYLFDVHLRTDSKAKDNFMTTAGGVVAAFGSAGSIVGVDAGYPGLDRFSGAVVLDDLHKVSEAHSDLVRKGVIENYSETIQQRPRGVNVPIVSIGQRVHEDDISAHFISGKDGYQWEQIILPALDSANNALYPEAFPKEMLLLRKETDPYVFASQYMQQPTPAGGSLFKPEWFVSLAEEPKMLATFITADTAETAKSYNDATAFCFWGICEIETMGRKTGELGLHWLDCVEIRIEPKDLESAFLDFWQECMRHPVTPKVAAIEKKSTGVTLVSVLDKIRGIQIRPIERTRASGSKTQRFLEMQPYIAGKCISYTEGARHMPMCLEHMSKITATDSHRHDDIADCVSDSVRIALIDKSIYTLPKDNSARDAKASALAASLQGRINAGAARNAPNRKQIY